MKDNERAELVKALRQARENIKALCGAANGYARKLGIMPNGKDKFRLDDWNEEVVAAIARAETMTA
jgi:hypothetical protein